MGQPDGKKLLLSNKPYFEALDKIIKDTPMDAIKASPPPTRDPKPHALMLLFFFITPKPRVE